MKRLRLLVVWTLFLTTLAVIPAQPAIAAGGPSEFDPAPYRPYSLTDSAVAPTVRILQLGAGLSADALPAIMDAKSLDGSQDATGWGTAVASTLTTVYPADKIKLDARRVTGSQCHPSDAQSVYQALTSATPAILASSYDVLLLNFDPWCLTQGYRSLMYNAGGTQGQARVDALANEIANHPLHPDYTTNPSAGPALTFDMNDPLTAFKPLGFSGAGDERHPYHDASANLASMATYYGPAIYWDRIVERIKLLQAAGLPIVSPAGDFGWPWGSKRREWQSIHGLATLDEVITVGAAGTTGQDDADRGWMLPASSSAGITQAGTVKPDLIAPGYSTLMAPKDSLLYRNNPCGSLTASYTCGQAMNSLQPYIPRTPGSGTTLTIRQGLGGSHLAAGLVALQVAQLRVRWPGTWRGGPEMTGMIRSMLQARTQRLTLAQTSNKLPAAPFEQGSGVLTGALRPEDVSKTPLLTAALNLPVNNARCPITTACKADIRVRFAPEGARVRLEATAETSDVLGTDLVGMAHRIPFSWTADLEPILAVTDCTTEPACALVMGVRGATSYAATDCGWTVVTGGEGTLPLSAPFCSVRALSIDVNMHYPANRPIPENTVTLDVYNPFYFYLQNPFQVSNVENPAPGVPLPSSVPPSLTLYSAKTDTAGNATFQDVVPGVYVYKPFGSYALPGYFGERAPGGAACSTQPCLSMGDIGSKANFQHTTPLVVSSALPCSLLPQNHVIQGHAHHEPLWPVCMPDESQWGVPMMKTDGNGNYLQDAAGHYVEDLALPPDAKSILLKRTDGSYVHKKNFYDDNSGYCRFPTNDAAYLASHFQGVAALQHDKQLISPDNEHAAQATLEGLFAQVPPYPATLGLACGPIKTRFGPGVASRRVDNLRMGALIADASGRRLEYDTSKHFSDFDLRGCTVKAPTPLAWKASDIQLVDIVKACAANSPPGGWAVQPDPLDPRLDSRLKATFDPLAYFGTQVSSATTLGTTLDLPMAVAHQRFNVFTPNYSTHMELSLDLARVQNAAVILIATIGDEPRTATIANVGHPVPVGAFFDKLQGVDPRANMIPSNSVAGDAMSCRDYKTDADCHRVTMKWDFRSLGADHGDLYVVMIPTSLRGDSAVEIDEMSTLIETFDKVMFERRDDNPAAWESSDREPNQFVVAFDPRLTDADVSGATPTCRADGVSTKAVCDDLTVYSGTPKGPSGGFVCTIDDAFTGLEAPSGDPMKVHAYDPGLGTSLFQEPKMVASIVKGPNGSPLVSTLQPGSVNGSLHGVLSVPYSEVRAHARTGTGAARADQTMRFRFGAYPGSCPDPVALPAPRVDPSCTTWAEDALALVAVPTIPYPTTAPKYCRFWREEQGLATTGFSAALWTATRPVIDAAKPSYCWYISTHTTGQYWTSGIARPMDERCP